MANVENKNKVATGPKTKQPLGKRPVRESKAFQRLRQIVREEIQRALKKA
jgi:hypothetical protein